MEEEGVLERVQSGDVPLQFTSQSDISIALGPSLLPSALRGGGLTFRRRSTSTVSPAPREGNKGPTEDGGNRRKGGLGPSQAGLL